jgi:AraC-like DNA-binding protein/mannose-6-phosphate isomerase-like protein (cupin superfamily)
LSGEIWHDPVAGMNDAKPRYHVDINYIPGVRSYGYVDVAQIGRRFCEADEVVPPHLHRELFELTICTRGEGTVSTNGVPTVVKSGDIYVSFPGDLHMIVSSTHAPLEYDYFAFKISGEYDGKLRNAALGHKDEAARLFKDERISYLLSSVIAEHYGSEEYTEKLIESALMQIVIYLIRSLGERKSKQVAITDAEVLCYQVMAYVDSHVYSIKNLTEIADAVNYNYSYLSALFKKVTGNTVFEYYQNKKLETARILISERKKKIGEIADMLGYSSVFAFSKAFKNKYGVSPKSLHTEK